MPKTIRLPRGSEFDGLNCPPRRRLSLPEVHAQRQGRQVLRLADPSAQRWVELNFAAEARLWDLYLIHLP